MQPTGDVLQTAADPAAEAAAIVARLSDADLVGQVLMPSINLSDAAGRGRPPWSPDYRLGGVILMGDVAEHRQPAGPRPRCGRSPTRCERRGRASGRVAGSGRPAHRHRPGVRLGDPDQVRPGAAAQRDDLRRRRPAGPHRGRLARRRGRARRGRHQRRLRPGRGRARPAGQPRDRLPLVRLRPGGRRRPRSAAAVRGLQSAGVAADASSTSRATATPPSTVTTRCRCSRQSRGRPGRHATCRRSRPASTPARGWSCPVTSTCRRSTPVSPASFSHKVLVDLLRSEMKFTGVVVTDALNMEPPTPLAGRRGGGAGAARRQRPAADAAGPRRGPAGAARRAGQPGACPASAWSRRSPGC